MLAALRRIGWVQKRQRGSAQAAVDLGRAVVTFNGKPGPRVVPLAPVAVEALATLPRKGGRVVR